ncbi:MAG: DUF1854 domain-containing protein [Armatimonadia bacterium]
MLNFLHRPGQPILGEIREDPYDPEELRLLDPATTEVRRRDFRLQCYLPEREAWRDVKIVRLFPYTHPEGWLSLQDKDGREIGVLETFDGMPDESRNTILDELGRRYLAPRIVRLLSRKQRFDVFQWTAETDRGRVTFLTRGLRDQLQHSLSGHFTFTDVEGNRYEVVDLGALDPLSRKLLEEQM